MADLKISALTASTTPLAGTEVLPIVQSSTTKQVSVANLTAGRAVSAANLTSLTNSQTGYTGLTLDNSSTFGTNNKYAQVAFTGRDTVNTTKTGAYVRGKPADDNLVGYGLQVFVRNSDTVAQSAEFTYQGNLSLNTGNLVIGTSGKGIDFSATPGTGTSELFADYEEGTFNATYETTGTNFTTITFSTQSFRYVKIGTMVFIQGNISTSNVDATGATGNIRIAGLPFTSASSSAGNNGRSTLSIANTGPWVIAPTIARVETSSTVATLSYYATTPATATTGLPVAAVITGAAASQNGITISGCYVAA